MLQYYQNKTLPIILIIANHISYISYIYYIYLGRKYNEIIKYTNTIVQKVGTHTNIPTINYTNNFSRLKEISNNL